MKKTLFCCILFFSLLFCFSAKATAGFEIKADKNEFHILNDNATVSEIAEIFSMSESELEETISRNAILYIAVNDTNTKQIRLSSSKSSFSESITNLSNLSEQELSSLSSRFSDIKNESCEIIEKQTQTFLKFSSSMEDSGGSYSLIRYVTVAGGKNYILSFYTAAGEDENYIDKVFQSFDANDFLHQTNKNQNKLILLAVLAAGVAVFILFTFLRDYYKTK